MNRRQWMMSGLAGAGGLAVAAKLADAYGLIPPDAGGIYGVGETLTYASQRLLARHALAKEFSRGQISEKPFVNETPPPSEAFRKLQAGGFADWRLVVEGLVAKPMAFSLADLRAFPQRSQITSIACEEGWSYVAEWTGVPLAHVLKEVGALPRAKYVAYFSIDPEWWDSLDMDEASHPQTLLTMRMNGGELPVGNGGPLRMRVARQLGYKNVKYVTRLMVTDSVKGIRNGLGSSSPDFGYSWFAGI